MSPKVMGLLEQQRCEASLREAVGPAFSPARFAAAIEFAHAVQDNFDHNQRGARTEHAALWSLRHNPIGAVSQYYLQDCSLTRSAEQMEAHWLSLVPEDQRRVPLPPKRHVLHPPPPSRAHCRIALLHVQGNIHPSNPSLNSTADHGGQQTYVYAEAEALLEQMREHIGATFTSASGRPEANLQALVKEYSDLLSSTWQHRPVHRRDLQTYLLNKERVSLEAAVLLGQIKHLDPATATALQAPTHRFWNDLQADRVGRVELILRQYVDPQFPDLNQPHQMFASGVEAWRVPCGPKTFVFKEQLHVHLEEQARRIASGLLERGELPHVLQSNYADAGVVAVRVQSLIKASSGHKIPILHVGHSLGGPKLDGLLAATEDQKQSPEAIARLNMPWRILEERLINLRADRVIVSTLTEGEVQYGHPLYQGAVPKKIQRVIPGIQLEKFGFAAWPAPPSESASPRVDRAAAARRFAVYGRVKRAFYRARHALPPQRRDLPIVLSAGRLDAKKNHLVALQAYAEDPLLRARANFMPFLKDFSERVVLTKKSSDSEKILASMQEMVETHDLQTGVLDLGLDCTQDEFADLLRITGAYGTGILAHVALHEPFGLMPLEAGMTVAVVVTQNGGPSESLREEDPLTGATQDFAKLVEPTNTAQIAGAILDLTDPETWERFRNLSRDRVAGFTWPRMAHHFLNIAFEESTP
jgi:glycosyltransferase involved in cell wall biosynthesis